MKVTPEIEVPTIATATTGHGERLPPLKKSALLRFFRAVSRLREITAAK